MKFNDNSKIIDADGNQLTTKEVSNTIKFMLVIISEEDKQTASSQSSASIVSLILTFGTSIFITVVMGGTIEATWLLLGSLQLMSLTPLFNLNLPVNFREFSKNLAVLHGEPQAIPNIFSNFLDTDGLKPFNPYFELMSKYRVN